MKNLQIILLSALLYSATAKAQLPADNALRYADSMLKSYRTNHLNVYFDLTYPGVVKYYGGTKNFTEFVERSKEFEQQQSGTDKVRMLQIANEAEEWQCVIQRTHETIIDNKRATIISYIIGQSLDDGKSWKFVDVALNSVANVTYIMPDFFTNLVIPLREVVYEKSIAAN